MYILTRTVQRQSRGLWNHLVSLEEFTIAIEVHTGQDEASWFVVRDKFMSAELAVCASSHRYSAGG